MNATAVICDYNLLQYALAFASGRPKFLLDFQLAYQEKHHLKYTPGRHVLYEKLLVMAFDEFNWDVINWLHKYQPKETTLKKWRSDWLFPAPPTAYYHISTVKWLHENVDKRFPNWKAYMHAAATNNLLDVLKFLHDYRTEGCSYHALDSAARGGHLEIVQFLHENRTEGCSTWAMDSAAQDGHLEIVRFLHENRQEGCTTRAMDYAAGHGHLNVVEFLDTHRPEGCRSQAMDWAAGGGHLHVVQYLHTNRNEGCTVNALNMAAANGHLNVVQFLHTFRQEGCTTEAMDGASKNGYLKVVQFLHQHRSEGCKYAIGLAARNGHVDIVQFLFENRVDVTWEDAWMQATWGKQKHVLKYLEGNRHCGRLKALNGRIPLVTLE